MESAGDVESTVVEFSSKLCHFDADEFHASRMQAVVQEELGDARLQIVGTVVPGQSTHLLCLCGKDVEKVEFEDEEIVGEPDGFGFAQCDESAFALGHEGAGEAWSEPEEAFGL